MNLTEHRFFCPFLPIPNIPIKKCLKKCLEDLVVVILTFFPSDIYLLKVIKVIRETLEQGVKYVQS